MDVASDRWHSRVFELAQAPAGSVRSSEVAKACLPQPRPPTKSDARPCSRSSLTQNVVEAVSPVGTTTEATAKSKTVPPTGNLTAGHVSIHHREKLCRKSTPPLTPSEAPHAHTVANTKYSSKKEAPLVPTFSGTSRPSKSVHSVSVIMKGVTGTVHANARDDPRRGVLQAARLYEHAGLQWEPKALARIKSKLTRIVQKRCHAFEP
eukprot:scaffold141986_cov29-Tisochrysis_lutea.AAC.7